MQSLLRQKVKHVFVLVQENHSFDNYFGLYPGIGGPIENLATSTAQANDCETDPQTGTCQRPFLITANKANATYYRADASDINGAGQSRYSQLLSIDGGRMDNFLRNAEGSAASTVLGPSPTPAQVQAHNSALNAISLYDCDTVPYLWYYAKNFALFDHYFQGNIGQSTEGNVELFAGQIGQTEVAAGKGPARSSFTGSGFTDGLPFGNDSDPPAAMLPFINTDPNIYHPDNTQYISVASMPMLLSPTTDAAAISAKLTGQVPNDFALEASSGRPSLGWAWYEEGQIAGSGAPSKAFSAHHAAPLYFDYINNPNSPFATTTTLKDNTYSGNGLISDIKNGSLPASGVFWVKGGAGATSFPFQPADPSLASQGLFRGTDDHPGSGSSDHQVAEAYLATVINAIAGSQYWNDSVIIVTWDDNGGTFDHLAPPSVGGQCPYANQSGPVAGVGCGDGVRLPLLIISPFVKTNTVVNTPSDGGSIIKFIENVFNLPTFASLPDEAAGVAAGTPPLDANGGVGDLTDAFDIVKLSGNGSNSPALATVPGPAVPPTMSCNTLGITPIASPATPPPGFQTAGYYLSTSPQSALRIPNNDDGD